MSDTSPHSSSPSALRVTELLRLVLAEQSSEVRTLWQNSDELLKQLQPLDVFAAFDTLLTEGHSASDLMPTIDRMMNLVRDYLDGDYAENASLPLWLSKLETNNEVILTTLSSLRESLRAKVPAPRLHEQIHASVAKLSELLDHYAFKENVLFPLLEQRHPLFRGLQLMWGKQDEARAALRDLQKQTDTASQEELSVLLGRLFFRWQGLVDKERVILFPAALSVLTGDDHEALNDAVRGKAVELLGSFTASDNPEAASGDGLSDGSVIARGQSSGPNQQFRIPSGEISLKDLLILLNHVPGDITWVDEDNKVKFYSEGGNRIFPRTPQVIGRDVNQCHPPRSVHVVEEIVERFRSGAEDQATFWIRRGDSELVLIRFLAVRDEDGQYRGVLEYVEEISEYQGLEGERRLLDWE